MVEWKTDLPSANIPRRWYDYIGVGETVLPKNKGLQGKSIREIAEAQGKGIIDGFMDLVVEENLDTVFLQGASNVDKEAMAKILNYPNAYIGLSDGGAHVQFHGGYGYSTRLLGYWVRDQGIMPLEHAVRRLTFELASAFGIYDRGMLQPGLAADITIFDPDTVSPLPEDVAHDFPAGGWRVRELATGIHYTIVNGQVLLEDGRHTGALAGPRPAEHVVPRARYGVNSQYGLAPSPAPGRGATPSLAISHVPFSGLSRHRRSWRAPVRHDLEVIGSQWSGVQRSDALHLSKG
jgi:N-acyl-D-aspartate/D-glutamate deacylase